MPAGGADLQPRGEGGKLGVRGIYSPKTGGSVTFTAPKLGVRGIYSPQTGGLRHLQPQNWECVALRAPKLGVRGIYSPETGRLWL